MLGSRGKILLGATPIGVHTATMHIEKPEGVQRGRTVLFGSTVPPAFCFALVSSGASLSVVVNGTEYNCGGDAAGFCFSSKQGGTLTRLAEVPEPSCYVYHSRPILVFAALDQRHSGRLTGCSRLLPQFGRACTIKRHAIAD